MTRGLVVFLVAVALPAVAVRSIAATGPAEVSLGSGAHEVWILRPVGAVRDIVVFGHGWSTPMPGDGFAAWIGHLRRGGSLVVYPRYRVGVGDSPSAALRAFQVGVIDALTHLEPIRVPILALGKSFGASAVFGAEGDRLERSRTYGDRERVSRLPSWRASRPVASAPHLRPDSRR